MIRLDEDSMEPAGGPRAAWGQCGCELNFFRKNSEGVYRFYVASPARAGFKSLPAKAQAIALAGRRVGHGPLKSFFVSFLAFKKEIE